jgi:hypothetical protein
MARPAVHLAVSTGLAIFQFARTGRLAPAVAPILTGFLIDTDHFAEKIRFKLLAKRSQGQTVLPLHGWEFLAFWFLVDRLFGHRLAGGLLLGYTAHLAIDQITNKTTHPLTYFISYRAWRGFPSSVFNHADESEVNWLNDSVFNLWKYF